MRFSHQTHSYQDVYDALNPVSRPNVDFYILLILATIISTFGLLLNSAAVIIGAMLIAPLMEPILGISFSSLTRNVPFAVRSTFTLLSGIFLAVFLSYLLSLPFPNLSITDEVLARIKPSLLDLFVALATGFLAGYARVRKHLSGTLYGVSVSISLLPPLCVVGIGFALGKYEIYTGASLLFLTNLISILFSGVFAFMLIRLSHYQKTLTSLIFPGVSLLILAIPLSFSLYSIQQKKTMEIELTRILRQDTVTFKGINILSIQTDLFAKPARMIVTVQGKEIDIHPNQVRLVEGLLLKKTGVTIDLIVNLTPVKVITSER
jgi:uncharacterized hydrophobic protein (TIGR00271 family)